MYANLLLAHKILVLVFLIHYVIKVTLLLLNRHEALDKYSKPTRIPEMIVSIGFLVTGGWMIASGAYFNTLLIVKLVAVFASIPLAVVGFKKKNKMLALLAVVLIVLAYGFAEMSKKQKTGGKINTTEAGGDPLVMGRTVYTNSCINCHGGDGKLGGSGSKDLTSTSLTAEEQKEIIRNGKGAMPGYKDLTSEQVDAVVAYVETLKK